jgi:hypothetical protein
VLRGVIDTSSLASYVLTQGELMRRVVAHWRAGTFALLSSPATRAELAGVLARPSIRQLATASLGELVRGLERFSVHVPGVLEVSGACRDLKTTSWPIAHRAMSLFAISFQVREIESGLREYCIAKSINFLRGRQVHIAGTT